jgi:hypothetical protein
MILIRTIILPVVLYGCETWLLTAYEIPLPLGTVRNQLVRNMLKGCSNLCLRVIFLAECQCQ